MAGRGGLRAGVAALLGAVVVAYAAFAWRGAEERALAAAEAEARALLDAVASGVESNLAAAQATEDLLARRLLDLASVLDRELAARPGREEHFLVRFRREHGLRGIVLLDDDLGVRAAVGASVAPPGDGPLSRDRLGALEAETVARRARERGLGERDPVVLGFGESPFGQRSEFLVARRAAATGGYLVLRQSTGELERLRERAGIERLLRDTAAGPAIAYLAIQRRDGTVLSGAGEIPDGPPRDATGWSETPSGRVLDVALPASWADPGGTLLRVGLAGAPVAAVIEQARRDVVVFTLLVLVTGAGGLLLLVRRERRALADEERLRRQVEAKERFAALGRLSSGVAHEIRSPLNALSMATQRLRREAAPEDPAARERFDELTRALREAVGRVDATVEDFLALGRDRRPSALAPHAIEEIVSEAIAAEHSDATTSGPPTRVIADRTLTLAVRALANLLRNAREVAPPGTTSVSWRANGRSVIVDVDDGGPGIPAGERERVFEPFHTARRGGTGLGLTIAKESVERMGGRIELAEAPGGGARFTVHLTKAGESR
jgi:signal transduction histidine kinase